MIEEFVCIATYIAKEGQYDDLRAKLVVLRELTTKEAGCLSYTLHQSLNNQNLFTIIERFISREAFEFHRSQQYVETFRREISDLLESKLVNHMKVIA